MYQKHVILCDLSLRKQVIKVTACVSDNSVRTSMIFFFTGFKFDLLLNFL